MNNSTNKLPRYKILGQKDLSHAGAKRYSAEVHIKQQANLNEVKEIIKEATATLIKSRFYRDNIVRKHFGPQKADVVWLKVFLKSQRRQPYSEVGHLGEVCSTLWINPDLAENMRPAEMQGEEYQGIVIDWCKFNFPEDWKKVN